VGIGNAGGGGVASGRTDNVSESGESVGCVSKVDCVGKVDRVGGEFGTIGGEEDAGCRTKKSETTGGLGVAGCGMAANVSAGNTGIGGAYRAAGGGVCVLV
jgi:hypothetical protein